MQVVSDPRCCQEQMERAHAQALKVGKVSNATLPAMKVYGLWRFDMFAFAAFVAVKELSEWSGPYCMEAGAWLVPFAGIFPGSILSTFLYILFIPSFFFSPLLFAVSALVRLKAMFSKVWIFHECLGTSCHYHAGCLKKPLNWASNTQSFVALIHCSSC